MNTNQNHKLEILKTVYIKTNYKHNFYLVQPTLFIDIKQLPQLFHYINITIVAKSKNTDSSAIKKYDRLFKLTNHVYS